MHYDIQNDDLRLLLRALIHYERTGGEDARIDAQDIKKQKENIIALLKPLRNRYNIKTRA